VRARHDAHRERALSALGQAHQQRTSQPGRLIFNSQSAKRGIVNGKLGTRTVPDETREGNRPPENPAA